MVWCVVIPLGSDLHLVRGPKIFVNRFFKKIGQ